MTDTRIELPRWVRGPGEEGVLLAALVQDSMLKEETEIARVEAERRARIQQHQHQQHAADHHQHQQHPAARTAPAAATSASHSRSLKQWLWEQSEAGLQSQPKRPRSPEVPTRSMSPQPRSPEASTRAKRARRQATVDAHAGVIFGDSDASSETL